MPTFGPSPKNPENSAIHNLESSFSANGSVVIGPTLDFGVETTRQIGGFGGFTCLHRVANMGEKPKSAISLRNRPVLRRTVTMARSRTEVISRNRALVSLRFRVSMRVFSFS